MDRAALTAAAAGAVALWAGVSVASAPLDESSAASASVLAARAPEPLVVALELPDQGFQVGAVRGREVTFATGYEVELTRALARRVGAPGVRFVNVPKLERRLASNVAWDLAIARFRPTPGAVVTFSDPYLSGDQAVLARRGLARPRSLAALSGLQLCAVKRSRGADVIVSRIRPAAPHLAARDENELLGWVETGRCDAALYEAPLLGILLRRAPRVGKVVGRIETGVVYAVALERGSTLIPRVNGALVALRANGTMRRLAERWLGFDPARLPVIR